VPAAHYWHNVKMSITVTDPVPLKHVRHIHQRVEVFHWFTTVEHFHLEHEWQQNLNRRLMWCVQIPMTALITQTAHLCQTRLPPKWSGIQNPDFQINLDYSDWISARSLQKLWIHYLVGVSHLHQVSWKLTDGDCMRNANKSPKIL